MIGVFGSEGTNRLPSYPGDLLLREANAEDESMGSETTAVVACRECGCIFGHSDWCKTGGNGTTNFRFPPAVTVTLPPVPVGWICPVCGRGMAPGMPSCACVEAKEKE